MRETELGSKVGWDKSMVLCVCGWNGGRYVGIFEAEVQNE